MRKDRLKTDTSFTMCIVDDPTIINGKCVLMINNIADSERLAKKRENDHLFNTLVEIAQFRDERSSGIGKKEGLGMPGGGIKVEDLETPAEAAKNEFRDETGFELIGEPILQFEQGYVFVMDSRTGRTIRGIPFKKGQTPSYKLKDGFYAVTNFVHVYLGKIRWEGSNFQKLLQKLKAEFTENSALTQEEIDATGMWASFDELDGEELKSLNIAELDEIKMMGIFPINFILEALNNPSINKEFYYRHLRRIRTILEKVEGKEVEIVF